MKIYFLSALPCALTVNETYFGMTDLFERSAELSLKDNLFIRFQPENASPVSFFLNENIRFTPPNGCEVYLLNDGIAIYAFDFPSRDPTLYPITQKRKENLLVTVYKQGRLQVSIQTEKDFFIKYLPPSFIDCEIHFIEELILLKSPDSFAIFNQNGEKLLLEKYLDLTVNTNALTARLPLCDLLRRTADCSWHVSGNTLEQTSFTMRQAVSTNGEEKTEKIREELLTYALFEGLLLGADVRAFLSEPLQQKADTLKDFLGEYVSVALTLNPRVCILLRKKEERLFDGVYFETEIENGLITDIKQI